MIEKAAAAERAVVDRYLARLWLLPGTRLGRYRWPPTIGDRLFLRGSYWWQAHLLDCLLEAQLRAPSDDRARRIRQIARTIWLRNRLSWVNNYFDDMAWLGLALQRARDIVGMDRMNTARPLRLLIAEMHGAWSDEEGGGIRWRRDTRFKNAPANGPAAILHARAGERERAAAITEWMTARLVDPDTGLVNDGLAIYDDGREPKLSRKIYTYCQGVYLGACLELGWLERARRTVDAIAEHLAPDGVLRGHGGGDGGLFTGITTRYLALAAHQLPEGSTARELVVKSAEACWSHARDVDGVPLFGPSWSSEPAGVTQHLSVQLGGWMALEAAATLTPSE